MIYYSLAIFFLVCNYTKGAGSYFINWRSIVKLRSLIILFLLCCVYAMSFFHRASPAILSFDIMESLSLNSTSFALLGSATMLGYGLTQIPSGLLTDIIGGRKTLVLYQCIAGVAVIVFSFSESLSSGVLSRFILGLGLAANVPAMKVLASWFSASQYSKATGVLLSCGMLGTLLASSPLAFLTDALGWRYALFASGIFTFLLAIATWFIAQDMPDSQKREKSIKKQEAQKLKLKEIVKEVLREKNFFPIFIWFFIVVGIMFVLLTMWLGIFFMQAYGFSKEKAGFILSSFALVCLITTPLVAVLSDSVFKSRSKVLALGTIIIIISLIPLVFFLKSIPQSAAIAFGGIIVITVSGLPSIAFTMIKECMPSHCMATAFGIVNTGAPICAFLLQNLFGHLLNYGVEKTGDILTAYSYGFAPLLLTACIALLTIYFMKDTFYRIEKN